MIRVNEFNPALGNTKNPMAKCKVVVNNSITREAATNSIIPEPIYPPPTDINNSSEESAKIPSIANSEALYKHIAVTFGDILKTNNPKLIANVIDMSGKVIIPIEALTTCISLITGLDRSYVTISYEEPEPGCINKINIVKNIVAIKVNGLDFILGYNRQFNILGSTFNISLAKTIC